MTRREGTRGGSPRTGARWFFRVTRRCDTTREYNALLSAQCECAEVKARRHRALVPPYVSGECAKNNGDDQNTARRFPQTKDNNRRVSSRDRRDAIYEGKNEGKTRRCAVRIRGPVCERGMEEGCKVENRRVRAAKVANVIWKANQRRASAAARRFARKSLKPIIISYVTCVTS